MSERVTVVDYGIGNVYSVCNALTRIGATPQLTDDPRAIATAERLILPGVGAFSQAMDSLRKAGHDESIGRFLETGRPFLGICIGMQMLMSSSTEFGQHAGLGLIEGEVRRIPDHGADGAPLTVPHVGWADVRTLGAPEAGPLALPADDPGERHFYFVHSYMATPSDPAHLLATTRYGGREITAAVGRDNILGLQFHPERSGPAGLALLARFVSDT
jgi:glutamine amidotransferase